MTNFPKRIADDLLEFKPSAMGAVRFPNAEGVSVHHSRFRRGTTLVELMIAMLILAIVCVAWLEIIGVQSARREARRREAVERLAGMMDAFMCMHKTSADVGSHYLTDTSLNFDTSSPQLVFLHESYNETRHLFPDMFSHRYPDEIEARNLLRLDPVCYRLVVVENLTLDQQQDEDLFDGNASSFQSDGVNGGFWTDKKWLIGLLYDSQDVTHDKKPFFRLPVCLGL